ncbi:hypothetical protein MPNT_370010 [Candidatus Methylacidithermus pantelleriae]|uniref:Uncharacterized protein n=1 Tax=Candidatus Methylacidithermus pantelleriae TaxID=2744239 RepID=A0A8J2BU14_9BACT|nr:hypothetical protein MPNT_370010 [Candidatus Methylacidithermus pantelleriae]
MGREHSLGSVRKQMGFRVGELQFYLEFSNTGWMRERI